MEFTDLLEDMSINAREWARMLEEQMDVIDSGIVTTAISRAMDQILTILLEELETAIATTEELEFQYAPLRERLIQVFDDPRIVQVTEGGEVYFNAEAVAGDWGDFWDGINYARVMMRKGGKPLSPVQKAVYWKTYIYESAKRGNEEGFEMYVDTIQYRLSGWGWLAPYWIILEHGNAQKNYAWPKIAATNFLYKARWRAQALFNRILREVQEQAENLIVTQTMRFLHDPESFAPYDVLDTFFKEGRQYLVYVTSRRRIGVALPKTYQQLKANYT